MRPSHLALCAVALFAVACQQDAPPAVVQGGPASGAFKTVISSGERVTLADHARGIPRTIFEFTADW